jgi:hypothetical protein
VEEEEASKVQNDKQPAGKPEFGKGGVTAPRHRREGASEQRHGCQVRQLNPIHYARLTAERLQLSASAIWG